MTNIHVGDGSVLYPGSMVFGNVKPGSRLAGIPANKAKYRSIMTEGEMRAYE